MRTCCKFLFVCSVLLCAAAAMAQDPTTIFQLDGNSANDGLACTYGPCDYWNLINLGGSSGVGRGSSAVNTFILGTAATPNFIGGGSKDPNDLNQWSYTIGSTPNKDTLNAGYAAAYNVSDFDVIFGADRLSPNGDANIGIWFFQEDVGLSGGSFINKATGLAAHHVKGDVFIVSAFVNGGGVSAIQAYEWDGSCNSAVKNPGPGDCAASNLRVLPTANIAFAITNSPAQSPITATWASYSGNKLASPLFFEGGLDVSKAFGNTNVPCFASFLEETRSSQSPTAVLKDFLLGDFPVCGMTITKSCGQATVDASGNFINFPVTFTVKNTGIGNLSGISVTDAVTYATGSTNDTPTSIVLAVTPSTLGPKGSATDTGTATTTLTSSANTVTDTATATDGTGTVNATSNTAMCHLDVATTLKMTKTCSTTLVATSSDVQVQVSFSGSVCNTGQSSITGLALTDFQDSSTAGHAITTVGSTGLSPCTTVDGVTGLCDAPATACTGYSGSYTPNTIDGTGLQGRFFFNDEAVITGASATVGTLNKVSTTSGDPGNGSFGEATASCPICDKGECVQ